MHGTKGEWSVTGRRRSWFALILAALSLSNGRAGADELIEGDRKPHAGMLRFPDVSATHIAFVYANDIWLVSRDGGTAIPLAGPPGPESYVRFSPDGKSVAFVGNYDGNRDLYTVPVEGGIPIRVTHHPEAETLCDWTADGRLLYFSNGLAGLARQMQLFTVPVTGGLPTRLSVPYGANGSISADGQWLAYTPHTIDHRTWKRYRGGMQTDVWLFDLKNLSSKKMTDWEGTDSQPMWHGKTVYYMSDAGPDHRLNIWSYDPATGKRTQVTKHAEYDVKWPSVGPGPNGQGEIVYQFGPDLHLLDLASGKFRVVEIRVPGDRSTIKPRDVDASKFQQGWQVSATGKRALVQARGDIWSVPAKNGSPRNHTRTSAVAERDPAWSPDGKSIAYVSDATGEYELYMIQADGKSAPKMLTSGGKGFKFNPTWSPDSKSITFIDADGRAFLHTLDPQQTKEIEREEWDQMGRLSWSHDSTWIAYVKGNDNRLSSIWLYHVPTGEKHRVTAGRFNDTWPVFDRDGKYLYFATNREVSRPIYDEWGTAFIYSQTDRLAMIPLRGDVGSPWAPKSDEEGEDEKDKKDGKEDKKDKDDKAEKKSDGETNKADADSEEEKSDKKEKDKEEKKEPLVIDLVDMEQRAVLVPVDRGNFTSITVNHEGKLIYLRGVAPGAGPDAKPSLKILDPKDEKKEEKNVVDGIDGYAMSADGKKLLVKKGETLVIVDAASDQKLEPPLSLAGMNMAVDPRQEWDQIFREAWRIKRDYMYDPNMHGIDWKKESERYKPMLEDCMSREDVSYVIGEMISELNIGHAYVRGDGDVGPQPKVSVGVLGADFELAEGAYRVAKIQQGAAWDLDARSALSRPGAVVKEGEFLLAVNGVPMDTKKDPWAAFQGLAGKTVRLTVSQKPTLDESARDVLVELLESEVPLRYRAWVEWNRKYVDEKTQGRVGYIHVPDTGINGQDNLFRQFYGQIDKEALIIDERWNGGGQIPNRFIELLNRPILSYWARRDFKDWPWPPDAHQGPKCMLINGLAGSGGDCLPYYFRKAGLGKLIGMRTWGGLVGISGNPSLIDGGQTWAPTFAFYETDGTWGVEGHGVDPDIEVIDDPAKMFNGGDPQLDAAIEHMLSELKRNPYRAPSRPAYPDRRGMGIVEKDK